jgi:hypothetical protein
VYFKLGSFRPATPRLQPPMAMPGLFLFSILILVFGSSHCLAMGFQQQTGGTSRLQSTGDSISRAAAPIAIPMIAATMASPKALEVTEGLRPLPQKPLAKEAATTSPVIVIGFLGGHVKKNNAVHSEVQIAMHLLQNHPAGVYAEVFQNAQGQSAFKEILRLLDVNQDGILSPAEKQQARIIIYGHSWGASETVTMARQLQSNGISVLLTVLVDRVSKVGEGDARIPANVAQAVNFYQLNGLLHGRRTIVAADPARTQILGNFRFDYKDNPVSCDQFPWYARLFMGPHIEIENDPRVWNQVESLIRSNLPEKTPQTVALVGQSY